MILPPDLFVLTDMVMYETLKNGLAAHLLLLNSSMLSSSYLSSRDCPPGSDSVMYIKPVWPDPVRLWKKKPKRLAAVTKAASSGDSAMYLRRGLGFEQSSKRRRKFELGGHSQVVLLLDSLLVSAQG
jgi:hypothetical protein